MKTTFVADQYARAWGWGVSEYPNITLRLDRPMRHHETTQKDTSRRPKTPQVATRIEAENIEKRLAEWRARQADRDAKLRVTCGAKTRAGHPCKMKSEPGRRRCKFHGGKSTGPRTAEGRARIAEAQRKRWMRSRVTKFINAFE